MVEYALATQMEVFAIELPVIGMFTFFQDRRQRKLMGTVLLPVFFVAIFLSLHYASFEAHAGSDAYNNCPFMTHEQTLCSMNMLQHVAAWKEAFIAIVPAIFSLFVATAVLFIVRSRSPYLRTRMSYTPIFFLKKIRERLYLFTYRHLQDLFSNGILHPKLF